MKITLPGLIDVHTHMRTPGQSHKEDFYTGTTAALNGGFTTIIDMPNNTVPITTKKLLREKMDIAKKQTVVDIGFHFGSLGNNLEEFKKVQEKIFGLKLYLNQTTGGFIIGKKELTKIYEAWEGTQPILLHAEEDVLDMVSEIVKKTKKKTHICHVSSKLELTKIAKAKERGLPVTCGITPHHLFLTNNQEKKLGVYAKMKPYLKSKKDVDFIWENLGYIDLIESDHAPHTIEEKETEAPFGVPGLDTTLPLLLTEVENGKLTVDEVIQLCHTNPSIIFNVPTSKKTFVEVSMEEYLLTKRDLKTKVGWSPFEGRRVIGKVKSVVIRDKKVFENGKVLIKPGEGRVIYPKRD
ncbi:MAG: amidohydrolase family protein [Candidatus Levybacteria bacterium]|nr:amidohydrolase family protein [Candidatus Levybacteria bacterium]